MKNMTVSNSTLVFNMEMWKRRRNFLSQAENLEGTACSPTASRISC